MQQKPASFLSCWQSQSCLIGRYEKFLYLTLQAGWSHQKNYSSKKVSLIVWQCWQFLAVNRQAFSYWTHHSPSYTCSGFHAVAICKWIQKNSSEPASECMYDTSWKLSAYCNISVEEPSNLIGLFFSLSVIWSHTKLFVKGFPDKFLKLSDSSKYLQAL